MSRERFAVCALGGLLSVVFAACGADNADGEPPCVECPNYASAAVTCNLSFGNTDVCGLDQQAAVANCFQMGGQSWLPATVCPLNSGETGSDPNNNSWSPSRDVIFDSDSGEYVLDQLVFEELKLDPAPLMGDSSQLELHESGYYLVTAVGELADALGWQQGDILLDANGYSLGSPSAVAAAYMALADRTAFRLTVERGRTKVVLRYRVE